MKRFLTNIFIFCILLILSFGILALFLFYIGNKKDHNLPANAIYVWGDSQMYQGLILSELSDALHASVYSAAGHGEGVYDLLVFADKVPAHSTCIIAYSQCCLLRKKGSDSNRSGVNIFALGQCWQHNYSIKELGYIYGTNRMLQKKIFQDTDSPLYPYNNTITFSEPLSLFEKMFAKEPAYYKNKVALMMCAIDKLKSKDCQVYIVAFPFYHQTADLYYNSPYKQSLDTDIQHLATAYTAGQIDSVYFEDRDSLCMHDLTHLNELGARRATAVLQQVIQDTHAERKDHFIILNELKCQ